MPPRVYIIDDDAAVRDSLALLLRLHGFVTVEFEGAEAFSRQWERNGPASFWSTYGCRG